MIAAVAAFGLGLAVGLGAVAVVGVVQDRRRPSEAERIYLSRHAFEDLRADMRSADADALADEHHRMVEAVRRCVVAWAEFDAEAVNAARFEFLNLLAEHDARATR